MMNSPIPNILDKDMPSNYNLEILDKPTKIVPLRKSKGAFATAYEIKLDRPLIVILPTHMSCAID